MPMNESAESSIRVSTSFFDDRKLMSLLEYDHFFNLLLSSLVLPVFIIQVDGESPVYSLDEALTSVGLGNSKYWCLLTLVLVGLQKQWNL